MTVRVRFAPSPTGYLHIGGARTALYNYLFAKAVGGKFIVRVEDTDKERSTKKFEISQMADLNWLGLDYDEGPEKGGDFGPYRQSERLDIYKEHSLKLLKEGKAFYDFCSDEELEAMKEKNQAEGTAAYTGKWRDVSFWEEAQGRIDNGEEAPIRYKVVDKDYTFQDKVRGSITFPKGMVGDFVIMRTNGLPTYNFCNVLDDHLQEISHVIRGEDHVNNTLRQLMIYEAIGATPPIFAHVSLLIGEDRQKLSKRHGATSVSQYREETFLPEALTNYLCLLGWSHPEEKDIFSLDELNEVFNLERFSKSHAIYDTDKLKWMNGQHLKELDSKSLIAGATKFISKENDFHKMSNEWKATCLELFKDKISVYSELEGMIANSIFNETVEMNDDLKDILSWETTPQIVEYVKTQLDSAGEYVTADEFGEWMNYCKKELKIKGKPLFMGFRGALTGQNHGPDLKVLIPLTPVAILKKRISNISK